MNVQIVEQVELFSEAELEILEFALEELEAIEAERVPNLDSISFEDIAEALAAVFEQDSEEILEGLIDKITNKLTGKNKKPPEYRKVSPPPPEYSQQSQGDRQREAQLRWQQDQLRRQREQQRQQAATSSRPPSFQSQRQSRQSGEQRRPSSRSSSRRR